MSPVSLYVFLKQISLISSIYSLKKGDTLLSCPPAAPWAGWTLLSCDRCAHHPGGTSLNSWKDAQGWYHNRIRSCHCWQLWHAAKPQGGGVTGQKLCQSFSFSSTAENTGNIDICHVSGHYDSKSVLLLYDLIKSERFSCEMLSTSWISTCQVEQRNKIPLACKNMIPSFQSLSVSVILHKLSRNF